MCFADKLNTYLDFTVAAHDFVDPNTKKPFAEISTVIKQWVGHILLNRSMNIAASATSSAQVRANADVAGVPPTLFFNSNALQCVLPDVGPKNVRVYNYVYASFVYKLFIDVRPAATGLYCQQ